MRSQLLESWPTREARLGQLRTNLRPWMSPSNIEWKIAFDLWYWTTYGRGISPRAEGKRFMAIEHARAVLFDVPRPERLAFGAVIRQWCAHYRAAKGKVAA